MIFREIVGYAAVCVGVCIMLPQVAKAVHMDGKRFSRGHRVSVLGVDVGKYPSFHSMGYRGLGSASEQPRGEIRGTL